LTLYKTQVGIVAPRATDDYEDRMKMIITTELAREKVSSSANLFFPKNIKINSERKGSMSSL
jgi:hypothetical protein